jgi:hypothetical protein
VPASASSIRGSAEIDGKIIRAKLAETEGNYIGAEIRFSNSIMSIRGLEYILRHTSVKIALQEASIDKKLKVQHLSHSLPHNAPEFKVVDEQSRPIVRQAHIAQLYPAQNEPLHPFKPYFFKDLECLP